MFKVLKLTKGRAQDATASALVNDSLPSRPRLETMLSLFLNLLSGVVCKLSRVDEAMQSKAIVLKELMVDCRALREGLMVTSMSV